MSHARARTIAIVGPGSVETGADDDVRHIAYDAGAAVARRGDVVLTGGLGGVMEAASRGARDEGGMAVGLLPSSDPDSGNEYLTLAIPTGLGELRNALLVRAADAVLAIGGSWGTLSEVALAVRTGTPIVCVRGWQVVAPGEENGAAAALPTAPDAATAVALLYTLLDARRG